MISRRVTKIVLNQHVPHLGEEGDVCQVARGYARNYLLPKGLASLCTREVLNDLKTKQQRLARDREDRRKRAGGQREQLNQMQLEIAMHAGESGHLFGAVNAALIVEKLAELGMPFERRHIDIPGRTIKEVGTHSVTVRLYDGEARLSVKIIGTDGHGKPLPTLPSGKAVANTAQNPEVRGATGSSAPE